MTDAELSAFGALLFGAWGIGFVGGWILTRFREALTHAGS